MYRISYRLKTTLVLCAIAAISGCVFSTNAQSSSHEWSGEWQIKDPSGSGGNVTIILTPEGKAYFFPPQEASNENMVYELPLERVSERTSLPEGAKVLTLTEVMQQQAQKARLAEAKTYIGSMNRAQQAYFLENNQFANNIRDLQLGIQEETDNYTYKMIPQPNHAKGIMHIAQAKRPGLKNYLGIVLVDSNNTTLAKLCETEKSLSQPPEMPKLSENNISCPSGFTALN